MSRRARQGMVQRLESMVSCLEVAELAYGLEKAASNTTLSVPSFAGYGRWLTISS